MSREAHSDSRGEHASLGGSDNGRVENGLNGEIGALMSEANICCFFASFKTLAMPTEAISPCGSQRPGRYSRCRFSGDNHWPVLGDR